MARKYDKITVKKYANRRLYDTSKSSYITLNDISEMIRDGLDFVVVDAKTNEDLTHTVLAQIVLDQESQKPQMFPTEFMRKIIGLYGQGTQSFVPEYLTHAMDSFLKNQEQLQKQFAQPFSNMGKMGGIMPDAEKLAEINRQNMAMFENAMQMFSPFAATEETPEQKDQKIADLEKQLKELKDKQS